MLRLKSPKLYSVFKYSCKIEIGNPRNVRIIGKMALPGNLVLSANVPGNNSAKDVATTSKRSELGTDHVRSNVTKCKSNQKLAPDVCERIAGMAVNHP